MLAEDAARCIAAISTSANVADLRRAAESKQPYVRRAAALALAKVGTTADVPLLIKLSTDEYPRPGAWGDPSVRDAATLALGAIGGQSGATAVIGRLSDEVYEVAISAARAISGMGLKEGPDLLKQAAASPRYIPRELVLAEEYARLRSGSDLPTLRSMIGKGDEIFDRGAARILARDGDQSDLPFFRHLLATGQSYSKYAALEAIRHHGNKDDLATLRTLATTSGHDWPIRHYAVVALAAIGTRDDFELLRSIAQNDEVKHIIGKYADHVCWRLTNRDDVPLLRKEMSGTHYEETLLEIIDALAKHAPNSDLLREMMPTMSGGNPHLSRRAAAITLARLPLREVAQALMQHANEISPAALAVLDWAIDAPTYLKAAREQWLKSGRR